MGDQKILDSRYSWQRLAVTLATATISSAGLWSIVAVMPSVQAEFGTDRATASLPYTLVMVGFALGNLVIGRAVDRYGITWSLRGAALIVGIGYFGVTVSPSITVFAASQFLVGVGMAVGFGPMIADISHWFLRRRGIAIAVVASGNYLSGVICPLALSGIIEGPGWRAAYAFLGIFTVATILPLSLLLRRKFPSHAAAEQGSSTRPGVHSIGIPPRALLLLLIVAGLSCCIAMSMPQVHIVSMCADLGFGPAVGAEMLSLMLFGGLASRLVSGFVADKIGGVLTLLFGSTLQCVALMLYLPYDGLVSLYVVSLVFGLSQGGIVPSYAVIVRQYLPAKEAGARVGDVIMATIFGMAIGGWMSGWIYDVTGSYQMAFVNGIAWNMLNMGIAASIFLLSRRRPFAGT